MQTIKTYLEQISSWSYLFGYHKDSLTELQKEFPSGTNIPYPKSFFIKLNKVRLANDYYKGYIQTIDHDSYGNKTFFSSYPKAFKKAEKKRRLAAKNFAIAKLQYTGSTIDQSATEELAALTNFWRRSALNKLRNKIRDNDTSPKASDKFYTQDILKEYASLKVIEITGATPDITKVLGKKPENKLISTTDFLTSKKAEYIADQNNQWRLINRVADNVSAALKDEIKGHDNKILRLKFRQAKIANMSCPLFQKEPLKYIGIKLRYIQRSLQMFFNLLKLDEEDKKTTSEEECKSEINKHNENKGIAKDKLQSIKDSRLWFFPASDFRKERKKKFFLAVAEGKIHLNKSNEELGLATELESKVYGHSLASLLLTIPKDYADESFLFKQTTDLKNNNQEILIKAGADLNAEVYSDNTQSILEKAIRVCNAKLVTSLISNGADIELMNTKGKKAIHIAVTKMPYDIYQGIKDKTDTIEALLENNAEINSKDRSGNTALHIAASKGDIDIVNLLLDKGIKQNIKNNSGQNAIHLAASNQIMFDEKQDINAKVIEALVKKDKDIINSQDSDGNTALHIIAAQPERYLGIYETINSLLVLGADKDIKNNEDKTPADLAKTSIFKWILETGTTDNAFISKTEAFISLVQNPEYGNMKKIEQVIVDSKQIINDRIFMFEDKVENISKTLTALEYAVTYRKTKLIGLLLDNGADINSQDSEGNTALHLALKRATNEVNNHYKEEYLKIIKLIKGKGANVDITNNAGQSPADLEKQLASDSPKHDSIDKTSYTSTLSGPRSSSSLDNSTVITFTNEKTDHNQDHLDKTKQPTIT